MNTLEVGTTRIIPYDLVACDDYPPSERIACNPHFPSALTICTFQLNPLAGTSFFQSCQIQSPYEEISVRTAFYPWCRKYAGTKLYSLYVIE